MDEHHDIPPPEVSRAILSDAARVYMRSFIVHDANGIVIFESRDYLDAVTFAGSVREH